MIDQADIDALSKAKVVDRDGDRVGTVGQVYVSDDGGEPLFVTVHTGLFGTNESFVPLRSADFTDGELRVAYDKQTIKDAPNVAADGAISDDEQGTIFDYYDSHAGGSASGSAGTTAGLGTGIGGSTTDRTYDDTAATSGSTYDETSATAGSGYDRDTTTGAGYDSTTSTSGAGSLDDRTDNRAGTQGRDTSGPTTDDAMTRSEERLNVGTQRVEAGRARLRKHIVTEQQTVNVPVSHEEVRLEREPITDANRGDAYDGPELSEEEHEVILSEERPVVAKETVPVERVRLSTEEVTEQQQVTENVRHEEITQEGGDDIRR